MEMLAQPYHSVNTARRVYVYGFEMRYHPEGISADRRANIMMKITRNVNFALKSEFAEATFQAEVYNAAPDGVTLLLRDEPSALKEAGATMRRIIAAELRKVAGDEPNATFYDGPELQDPDFVSLSYRPDTKDGVGSMKDRGTMLLESNGWLIRDSLNFIGNDTRDLHIFGTDCYLDKGDLVAMKLPCAVYYSDFYVRSGAACDGLSSDDDDDEEEEEEGCVSMCDSSCEDTDEEE